MTQQKKTRKRRARKTPNKNPEASAFAVPDSVYEDKPESQAKIEVVRDGSIQESMSRKAKERAGEAGLTSYFDILKPAIDPSKADGLQVTDWKNYVEAAPNGPNGMRMWWSPKTGATGVFDRDGTPVEFRRVNVNDERRVSRAQNRGYVPCRVNEKTQELDPSGKPVGGSGWMMMVRRKQDGDIFREHHKGMMRRLTKSKDEERRSVLADVQSEARKLGLEDHLVDLSQPEEVRTYDRD